MIRPKSRNNQDLPQRLIRRTRRLRSGKIWIGYYYNGRDESGRRVEIPLGSDRVDALRKWAEFEAAPVPTDASTMRTVFDRYEREIIPEKAPGGRGQTGRRLAESAGAPAKRRRRDSRAAAGTPPPGALAYVSGRCRPIRPAPEMAAADPGQCREGRRLARSHPPRQRSAMMTFISPTPAEIRAARETAGITQSVAGELVCCQLRTWQQWESGDRKMPPGLWELFKIKTELGRN